MNKSRHFDGFVPVDFIKTTLAPLWNEGLTYDYHISATIISIIPITTYRELKILKAF